MPIFNMCDIDLAQVVHSSFQVHKRDGYYENAKAHH